MDGDRPLEEPAARTLLAATPYRVLRSLGGGAMGDVFEADHVGMGKTVVVKVMRAEFAQRPDIVDRMRIEGQALARLAHPNVVPVLDLGWTGDGRPFVVMERLVGRTLEEELRERGSLPFAEAIDRVIGALAGLGAAHAIGIVHRDVKLANLFVCDGPDGRPVVKVLDFGLAKVIAGGHRAALAPAPLVFPTAEGMLVGTPRYVSPEQALGRAVDLRTDLYAIGVVLYCLVAGRGPFDHHKTASAVIKAQIAEVPLSPSRHASQPIPAALDAAVDRALAKRPEERFASAAELASALAQIARSPGPMAAPPRRDDITRPTGGGEAPTRVERPAAAATAVMTRAPDTPLPRTARIASLGTASLAFGAIGLTCWVLYAARVVFVLVDPSSAVPSPEKLSAAQRATCEALAVRVGIASSVRLVALMIASGVLVALALRLRRGDEGALRPLRIWTLFAFGVVALWTLVDLAVALPATRELDRMLFAAMRASGGNPDTVSMSQDLSNVMIWVLLVGVPLLLAALPLALRIWSRRLLVDRP